MKPDVYAKLLEYIKQHYANGYYIYSFVISPKPDGPYDSVHPAKAHRKFEETFKKYITRIKEVSYLVYGELSNQGKYHVHGLIFFKGSDYDAHDKILRNFKNWIRRTYGWHGFQRIYSLTDPYKTTDLRFMHKEMSTTFDKIYSYITKDVGKFQFLYPFGTI